MGGGQSGLFFCSLAPSFFFIIFFCFVLFTDLKGNQRRFLHCSQWGLRGSNGCPRKTAKLRQPLPRRSSRPFQLFELLDVCASPEFFPTPKETQPSESQSGNQAQRGGKNRPLVGLGLLPFSVSVLPAWSFELDSHAVPELEAELKERRLRQAVVRLHCLFFFLEGGRGRI